MIRDLFRGRRLFGVLAVEAYLGLNLIEGFIGNQVNGWVSGRGLDSKPYMAGQQSPILQTLSPRSSSYRFGSEGSSFRENCTLIETIPGEVKLITRSKDLLVSLVFPNLKDCLEYVDRNRLQINVIHSGKRRESGKDHFHQ